MSGAANPARGEAALAVAGRALKVRPSFQALVAAEEELGPLLSLVERAGAGQLSVRELVALIWHCLDDAPPAITRERLGEAIVEAGIAAAMPVLKTLVRQILGGRGD